MGRSFSDGKRKRKKGAESGFALLVRELLAKGAISLSTRWRAFQNEVKVGGDKEKVRGDERWREAEAELQGTNLKDIFENVLDEKREREREKGEGGTTRRSPNFQGVAQRKKKKVVVQDSDDEGEVI